MASGEVATRNAAVRSSAPPRTEYIRLDRVNYSSSDAPPSRQSRWPGRVAGTSRVLGSGATRAQVPQGVPAFLGNQRTVVYAWMAAMATITVDEWHRHHMLPRPSRLWWASLFYGMLAIMGMAEGLIPLVNAFAIGYLIRLLWQYYNGEGQFA